MGSFFMGPVWAVLALTSRSNCKRKPEHLSLHPCSPASLLKDYGLGHALHAFQDHAPVVDEQGRPSALVPAWRQELNLGYLIVTFDEDDHLVSRPGIHLPTALGSARRPPT